MKFSWNRLQLFAAAAEAYLVQHKGETKIAYAIKRIRDQIVKHSESLQVLLGDIEIDLCVITDIGDQKEVIVRDAQGNLQFTRENLKEKGKRQRELLAKEKWEIEPYFLVDVPKGMTLDTKDAFAGILIKEEEVDSEPNGEDKQPSEQLDVQATAN